MSNNDDWTIGNSLDFVYFFLKKYKLIAINLSKQTKLKDPQQISLFGRTTMFFIIEKLEETIFEFLQNSVNIL